MGEPIGALSDRAGSNPSRPSSPSQHQGGARHEKRRPTGLAARRVQSVRQYPNCQDGYAWPSSAAPASAR
jgi:hypothetical protein